MKNFSLLAIFIALISTSQLFAQNVEKTSAPTIFPKLNVSVKGQVIDSLTNESLPYATLKITTKENPEKAIKLLATDESGKFEVKMDNAGDYLLAVNFVGKNTFMQPFTIKETEKQVNLEKLLISDNKVLDEVVVTAFKPLVKVDLDKITYSTEDDPDSKTNNVLEMLKKVPMVTVDAEEKIELKGSKSYKIHLDGKPSNLISNNPTQVLKSMPANTVKSIEIITDPGAKYDAEGVTGIINIITNKQPMGGYTASLNSGVSTLGSINAGAYLTMKYGKFGATVNYNYYSYNSPETESHSYREAFQNPVQKYLYQDGTSSNKGSGQYSYGELSYEIDTLNLLSASFNMYGGKNNNESDLLVQMQNAEKNPVYSYKRDVSGSSNYGSTDMNVDYQRTFQKKDELLTASYRLSMSPDDSKSDIQVDSILNYLSSRKRQNNDAEMKEHTFQLDYTTPFAKIHTLEGGGKYIIRINESNSGHDTLNMNTNQWGTIPLKGQDQFHHRQDILAAYLGYNVRYQKIGFKAGLRFEETHLSAEFPLNTTQNFESNYSNLIPSATFSYMYKQIHNFRLSYNMRIQRPGIWYLNPYIDNTDPKNISQGNPELKVEKSNNLSLNYGIFKPKFNINATLYYNYMTDAIQRVSTMVNDINYSTYENAGTQINPGLYLYANWNPTKNIRIYINAGSSYTDIRTGDNSEYNYGFQERLFGGVQYTLPKDFVISFNGGFATSSISLQEESSGYQYTSIGLNKSFLNKKLTISVSGSDLFSKDRNYWNIQQTDQFYSKNDNFYPSRNVRFSVSYRFGEMKQQIQKVKRGINNDDAKAGEGGSSSGESGGQK